MAATNSYIGMHPVTIVTARNSDSDELKRVDTGTDDYLLAADIQLRRSGTLLFYASVAFLLLLWLHALVGRLH